MKILKKSYNFGKKLNFVKQNENLGKKIMKNNGKLKKK